LWRKSFHGRELSGMGNFRIENFLERSRVCGRRTSRKKAFLDAEVSEKTSGRNIFWKKKFLKKTF